MKLTVNIEKRYAYFIMGLLILLLAVLLVGAAVDKAKAWHLGNAVEVTVGGAQMSLQEAIDGGKFGGVGNIYVSDYCEVHKTPDTPPGNNAVKNICDIGKHTFCALSEHLSSYHDYANVGAGGHWECAVYLDDGTWKIKAEIESYSYDARCRAVCF